ncbi:hypothetical protein AWB76_07189 [Caballeronia temeraria]|uniref:Uncharacterized protein n=1 Tax=Caballeronia temeraria TaxID=1777137 RepID=A0A158DNG8_9BURK|nr:hypothetical protein [Caballeronia temeraria]SAK95756.1 hypothetical protein AWB76_07189 [Caballeronia temeraria]
MDFDVNAITTLYQDEALDICKYEGDSSLYLCEGCFEETPDDVVELNPAQQLALYAILKNRIEG